MATLNERVGSLEDSLQNDFAVPFRSVMIVLDQHTVKLDQLGQATHTQMNELKKRMFTIEVRMGNMDDSFEVLRGDVNQIRSDVNQIRGDVNQIRGDVNQVNQKLDQLLTLLLPGKE